MRYYQLMDADHEEPFPKRYLTFQKALDALEYVPASHIFEWDIYGKTLHIYLIDHLEGTFQHTGTFEWRE
jgi:hypothetical protein